MSKSRRRRKKISLLWGGSNIMEGTQNQGPNIHSCSHPICLERSHWLRAPCRLHSQSCFQVSSVLIFILYYLNVFDHINNIKCAWATATHLKNKNKIMCSFPIFLPFVPGLPIYLYSVLGISHNGRSKKWSMMSLMEF